MLSNCISKLICVVTLCAFLFQPQWLEAKHLCKAQQTTHFSVSKANGIGGYVVDQNDTENESDDDLKWSVVELPANLNLLFSVLPELNGKGIHFHFTTVRQLNDRRIWLIFRKIIL